MLPRQISRQGAGFHFDPSGSRLKCMLVVYSRVRYFGSVTYCDTISQMSPFGKATRSQCSTSVVSWLYGTPFFRSHPSTRFVVTTLRARDGGAPPRPAPMGPSSSHSATEYPCSEGEPY